MTYPVSDKVKEVTSDSCVDTAKATVFPATNSTNVSPEEKVQELSKAVAKNQVIGSKESLDVASKCQDEISKILKTVPEEKRTELIGKCKEARAKGREEIQEEIKKNGAPKTPWYSPIMNFGETIVDTGIAVAGTVATLPKLPEVIKAQANGAATALKEGKGITGAITEGFKAGYNKHVENLEVAGEAINAVREFSENHLGGSYLGSEKELAAKSDISLAATAVGAGAQVALLPEALVCAGIQTGMNGVDRAYSATVRKAMVKSLGEDSGLVKAGDVALEVGKIGVSVAAVAKGQGSSALRTLGVATGMSGTSALASELYTAKLPGEEFSLGRLAENTLKGTAGSAAFMGGLTLGGQALALRSASNAIKVGQSVEAAANQATKTALKLSTKADFVDAVTGLGQTADMWDNSNGSQQEWATLLQLGVNAFDSKDCVAAGAVGHVNVQDIASSHTENNSPSGAYIPNGQIELDLAKAGNSRGEVYNHELFHAVVAKGGVAVANEEALVNALTRQANGKATKADFLAIKDYAVRVQAAYEQGQDSANPITTEQYQAIVNLVGGEGNSTPLQQSSPEFLANMHRLGVNYDINAVEMTNEHVADLVADGAKFGRGRNNSATQLERARRTKSTVTRTEALKPTRNDVSPTVSSLSPEALEIKGRQLGNTLLNAYNAVQSQFPDRQTQISVTTLMNDSITSQHLTALTFIGMVADKYNLTPDERRTLQALFDVGGISLQDKIGLFKHIQSLPINSSLRQAVSDLRDVFTDDELRKGIAVGVQYFEDTILNVSNQIRRPLGDSEGYPEIGANKESLNGLDERFNARVQAAKDVLAIDSQRIKQMNEAIDAEKQAFHALLTQAKADSVIGNSANIEYLSEQLARLSVIGEHEDTRIMELLNSTDPNNRKLQIAGLLHDIGKAYPGVPNTNNSGLLESDNTRDLVASIYGIKKSADKSTPIGEFLSDRPDLQYRLAALENPFTGRPFSLEDSIGDFWAAHSLWSVQMLEHAGVDPEIVRLVSQHHMADVNDGQPVFQQVDSKNQRITRPATIPGEMDQDALMLFIADQYDAAVRRGGKTSEEGMQALREKSSELSSIAPELKNLVEDFNQSLN